MKTSSEPLRIAVLVSGSGTNLQALIDAIEAGHLNARIELVVASNPDAYGIERAKKAGLETLVFQREDYAEPEKVDQRMIDAFKEHDIAYVIMAGYMRKVTPLLLNAYPSRIVNLHPALLPKHPGAHGIQEAFEAGDKVTGITFHFANEEYDQGPIIVQKEVPVLPNDTLDTLEARIHDAEHAYYPKVVQLLADGRVHVGEDGAVTIDQGDIE